MLLYGVCPFWGPFLLQAESFLIGQWDLSVQSLLWFAHCKTSGPVVILFQIAIPHLTHLFSTACEYLR